MIRRYFGVRGGELITTQKTFNIELTEVKGGEGKDEPEVQTGVGVEGGIDAEVPLCQYEVTPGVR
jgi:hypothetical protein